MSEIVFNNGSVLVAIAAKVYEKEVKNSGYNDTTGNFAEQRILDK